MLRSQIYNAWLLFRKGMVVGLKQISLILLFLHITVSIWADTVYLRDGRKIKGKLLAQNDREVKVQVTTGSIKAVVILQRADVVRIVCEQAPRELLEKEYQEKMRQALSSRTSEQTAQRLLALARWAQQHGLVEQTNQIYRQLVTMQPERADLLEYEWAQAAVKNKQYRQAQQVLQRLLKRNPNHEQARLLADTVATHIRTASEKQLNRALQSYMAGSYENALALLVKFVQSHSPAELEMVSKTCQAKFGQSLAAVMVDCRFHRRCHYPGCQEGVLACPNPKCHNGLVLKTKRPRVNYVTGKADNNYIRWTYCPRCKGKGYLFCPRCHGTGFDFGRPTEYEKQQIVATLLAESQRMMKDATGLVKKAMDPKAEINVRALQAQNILDLTRRARFLMTKAMEWHRGLGAVGGLNLSSKIRQTNTLQGDVISALARAYLTASDLAYQQAVNTGGDGQNQERRSLPARTVRAKQALELAKAARIFVLQLLEDDPRRASPLRGNLRQLLKNIDEYIRRCLATYNSLKEAEKRGFKLGVDELSNMFNLPGK